MRRPAAGPLIFLERFQYLGQRHLSSEIALVESLVKNGFIDRLLLGERELFRQQLKSDRRVFQLVAQPLQRIIQDFRMVEGE